MDKNRTEGKTRHKMTSSSPSDPISRNSHGLSTGVPGRVLVVDDDADVRGVIQSALSRTGYDVDVVESGVDALEIFKNRPVDIVISDWKMPGMNGIQLVNRLKRHDPALATILMTGYGTKETVIEAFTRGRINYYLSKPFSLSELLETVAAAFRERRIQLSDQEFRSRLESEIQRATDELNQKNRLLQQKHAEAERLYVELRSHQDEIRNTRDYLEHLIASSVDGIISLDREYRISFFSKGAETMFGYTTADVLAKPISDFFVNGSVDLQRLKKRLKTESTIKHFEADMNRRGGQTLSTDISASLLKTKTFDGGLLLVIKDIADRKRLEEELRTSNMVLQRLSITDGLTGLFNHRHFQKCLTDEFHRAKRFNTPLAFILLDIDDFKLINDGFGHQTGDKALELLADLVRESIREVDTAARYGGEEFTVILPQTDLQHAVVVAERIKDAVEWSPRFRDIDPKLSLTVSIGVSGYPDTAIKNPEDLIRYADKALYRAKQIGKNRIVIGSSTGETPLGRGERLTPAEKRAILRRIAETLRGTLVLKDILEYLLKEIAGALGPNGSEPPCSILLMDPHRGLEVQAERHVDARCRALFDAAARKALQTRSMHISPSNDDQDQATSYPIIIDSASTGREVLGIINIGAIPPDLEFFQDLANQAAMGILNAKLYQQAEESRLALEKKVDELTVLSLMDMALQRNALAYEDYDDENLRLVARCLSQIGFQRAVLYRYDPASQSLTHGADNSLRGDGVPDRISLSGLPEESPFRRALSCPQGERCRTNITFSTSAPLSPEDRRIVDSLRIVDGEIVLARLVESEEPVGLVMGIKPEILESDRDALAMFVLHGSIIMENLNLVRNYQDRGQRLTLINETFARFSGAADPGAYRASVQHALTRLTDVLGVEEISCYLCSHETQTLTLLAYTSVTARPGTEPADEIPLKHCRLMKRVVQKALETGRSDAFLVEDVAAVLGDCVKDRYATRSYIGLPVFGGDTLLGVVNITDKVDRSPFGPDELELAEITAGVLAVPLRHLRTLADLEFRIRRLLTDWTHRLEPGRPSNRKSHAEKVGEVAAQLAKTARYGDNAVNHVRCLALTNGIRKLRARNALDQQEVDKADRVSVSLLTDATDGLEQLHSRLAPVDETFPNGLVPEACLALAEAFQERYLGLPTKKRPPLTDVLLDFLAETKTGVSMESVLVLFRTLVIGMPVGRSIVRLEPADVENLVQCVTSPPSLIGGRKIPVQVQKSFLNAVKEEDLKGHESFKTK